MFCPRCGRPVNPTANFCGGCGLPKAEIEKSIHAQAPAVDINELNSTIDQLENDLTGVHSVENYTTYEDINTNFTEEVEDNIPLSFDDQPLQHSEKAAETYQSQYSQQAPKHPYYTAGSYSQPVSHSEPQPVTAPDQNLSTVDFIWMMLISSVPVVGFLYLIYQAFVQKDNVNRQSWAKATIVLYLFTVAIGIVFSIGIAVAQFMYW